MEPVLGLDVAKASLSAALQVEKGHWHYATFANTPDGFVALHHWLRQQCAGPVSVCLEATGRYSQAVATYLHLQGATVSVVNPKCSAAYAQSKPRYAKHDRADAKLLADYCATQAPPAWTPPSATQQALQELTRYRQDLKQEQTRLRNRLSAGVTSSWVRRDLETQLAHLQERMDQLEQELAQQVRQDDELRQQVALLTSIPGIGACTATRFLAEVPDVQRFSRADQLAAYAGLTPTQHDSGTSVHRKAKLSKAGNVHLRNAFYMPALNAARFNPLIKPLVERLERKGKPKMVIVAAVMRKLIHLAYGVLKSGRPFDPTYRTAAT